ncbi:transglutaminase family protein, partial [Microterricola pindariensis]
MSRERAAQRPALQRPSLRRPSSQRFALRGEPYWLLAGAVMLLAATGILAIAPLLARFDWWWASAAMIGVVGCASAVLRGWRVPPALVPVLASACMLVVLTLTFGAGTGLLLLLPTPDTFAVFGSLLAEGQLSIQTQAVPAEATPGIVFLLAIGGGILVLLMDALGIAVRLPALAGIPVAVLLMVPTVVLRQPEQLWVLVFAAGAYLLLLRVDVRTRRFEEQASAALEGGSRGGPRVVAATKQPGLGPLGGAVGVGAFGIVAALFLTAATPLVSLGAQLGVGPPSSSLFGGAVNPLIDLGQDLRRPTSVPALSYSSDGNRPVYLKMLTLDSFAGESWVAGHSAFNQSNTVDAFPAPPGLGDQVSTLQVRTNVQIANVRSEWLPVPYPATSIEGLRGQWYWDSSALTVATTHSSIAGQNYVVNALELAPTQEDLAASGGAYPAEIASYVELPSDTPELIRETALAVTAEAGTPYLKAAAIQKFLRGRDFSYSEQSPVESGFDGGGLRAIEQFLIKRSGYCIHFASAMAVMARSLDIPSRISLGYAPGQRSRERLDGEARYDVQSSDLHAWPELYFENVGWVPFEPTPGRGSVPSYSLPSAAVTAPLTPTPGSTGAAAPGRDLRALDEQ